VLVTNGSGTASDSYTYGAWGAVLASQNNLRPYQYVGELGYYRHSSAQGTALSDLLQLGVRFYDPSIGRFTQRDALGYADGPNSYLYVRNNPFSFLDPTGLFTTPCDPGGGGEWKPAGSWQEHQRIEVGKPTVKSYAVWIQTGSEMPDAIMGANCKCVYTRFKVNMRVQGVRVQYIRHLTCHERFKRPGSCHWVERTRHHIENKWENDDKFLGIDGDPTRIPGASQLKEDGICIMGPGTRYMGPGFQCKCKDPNPKVPPQIK
jgi:RHS repeat-associated protein